MPKSNQLLYVSKSSFFMCYREFGKKEKRSTVIRPKVSFRKVPKNATAIVPANLVQDQTDELLKNQKEVTKIETKMEKKDATINRCLGFIQVRNNNAVNFIPCCSL